VPCQGCPIRSDRQRRAQVHFQDGRFGIVEAVHHHDQIGVLAARERLGDFLHRLVRLDFLQVFSVLRRQVGHPSGVIDVVGSRALDEIGWSREVRLVGPEKLHDSPPSMTAVKSGG
jgi:hypothetical protein